DDDVHLYAAGIGGSVAEPAGRGRQPSPTTGSSRRWLIDLTKLPVRRQPAFLYEYGQSCAFSSIYSPVRGDRMRTFARNQTLCTLALLLLGSATAWAQQTGSIA